MITLNLKELASRGLLEFVGFYNDENLFERIRKSIYTLNFEKRIRMGRIGRNLIDGEGGRRTVKEIIKELAI